MFSLDKNYLIELNIIWDKYNILEEHREKIISEIYEGLPDSELTVNEIYDYFAKIIFQHSCKDPDFSKISSEYQVKIYSNTIGTDYLNLIKKQHELGLISDIFYNFICEHNDKLSNMLVWERDGLIDYFGLKTLERSYLLKDLDKKFIERPQMMWLRCSIQIHGLHGLTNTNTNSNTNSNTNTNTNTNSNTNTNTNTNSNTNLDEKLRLIKETYDYMSELYFTHATPTLFNSGSNFPQLSSCYLLQCPDDLEQIGNSFKSIMMISKWAGGIGINLSDIRSTNSLIKSNGGRTNGIIPLCKVLESLARYVNQSSKRLGSIACYLEVFHADIEDFIELRKNTGDEHLRTRDLFLGLWVCDAFMRAIESDGDWYLMNPNESIGLTDSWGVEFESLYAKYILEGKYVKKVKARELYKKITDCQFETGMPYMMFKDTINARSNQQNLGTIKNSNLCCEITEYSSQDEIAVCNLASISLPKFVSNINGTMQFDFDKFGKIVQIITTNLNNIIDLNFYPVPQTAKSNFSHRPIGIGIQGLADCYFMMGYSFDSDQAIRLNKQIFECIYWNALTRSNDLAKIYGKYSSFDSSPFSQGKLQFHLAGFNELEIADNELNLDWANLINDIKTHGTRNCLLTTVMPTASTSQILNNNESIEPYASNMYVRKVLSGEYLIVNKHLVKDLKAIKKWNVEILTELQYDNGSVQKLDIPDSIKNKYKTAFELKQSVIVKQSIDRGLFIDQSQSMNLFMEMPDHNKLASAHIYAWKNGLKTGSYYIRSKPVTEATKFSIDIDEINMIKTRRNEPINNKYYTDMQIKNNYELNNNQTINTDKKNSLKFNSDDEICTMCSA
jgi:ribonucleoside-diphosphate reductase alpha subunit